MIKIIDNIPVICFCQLMLISKDSEHPDVMLSEVYHKGVKGVYQELCGVEACNGGFIDKWYYDGERYHLSDYGWYCLKDFKSILEYHSKSGKLLKKYRVSEIEEFIDVY